MSSRSREGKSNQHDGRLCCAGFSCRQFLRSRCRAGRVNHGVHPFRRGTQGSVPMRDGRHSQAHIIHWQGGACATTRPAPRGPEPVAIGHRFGRECCDCTACWFSWTPVVTACQQTRLIASTVPRSRRTRESTAKTAFRGPAPGCGLTGAVAEVLPLIGFTKVREVLAWCALLSTGCVRSSRADNSHSHRPPRWLYQLEPARASKASMTVGQTSMS